MPYDPRLMVKVMIYGYSHGITSSRALERRCHDDIAFGFLTAHQTRDFVAISWFSDPARAGVQGVVHPVGVPHFGHHSPASELVTQQPCVPVVRRLLCTTIAALAAAAARNSAIETVAMAASGCTIDSPERA